MFGEMADELLLASTRIQPIKLLASGYQFHYPELEEALQHLLAR
jgi:NAD dependent epimerase/dehydratase family enzyme